MRHSILVPLFSAAFFMLAPPASAVVEIDWVTVGAPGNSCQPETHRAEFTGCFGGVDYRYRMGKFEVTNAQYAEFLNAVAATDTNGVWNPQMQLGGFRLFGIARSGSAGSYSYAPEPGGENKPVQATTFQDAMRFANWLHNGQPQGMQDESTTEDGAYTLTPEGLANNSIARNPGATVFVPSPSEWYKAAYFDPASKRYYLFPAGSDDLTTCDLPGATPNTANCGAQDPGYPSIDWVPEVGSYTASASPNGTFDQAGSVWEWYEGRRACPDVPASGDPSSMGSLVAIESDRRGIAGEDFGSSDEFLGFPTGIAASPSFTASRRDVDENAIGQGFRVASILDEPIEADRDADGISDEADNCPKEPNADQANIDGDEFGDVCDPNPEDGDDLGVCLEIAADQTSQQEQLQQEFAACREALTGRASPLSSAAEQDRAPFESRGARACPVRPRPAFVDVEWVTIGDPGNPCIGSSEFPGCSGSVDDVYRIGKFEITNAQYVAFLNAVAAADTHALYNRNMRGNSTGSPRTITRSGRRGCFSYAAVAGSEDKPVTYVSFADTLRFVNWLYNGQPLGPQGDGTTEDGAYTLTRTGLATNSITRNPEATVFLTSDDEWYKAAYYDSEFDRYFRYPTASSVRPTCPDPGSTPNSANCKELEELQFGNELYAGNATDVGSYTASPSPSGTFDQAGNVWEWTDTIYCPARRGLKGGSFLNQSTASWNFRFGGPSYETQWEALDVGFRLASLSETPTDDGDGDGSFDFQDNCPADSNADQANLDGDAFGDACDPYPDRADNLGVCTVTTAKQSRQIDRLEAKLDKCLHRLSRVRDR